MSKPTKRMKSRTVRDQWKDVLTAVEAGEEVIVERFNQPVARIIPYTEDTMPTITADHIRELAEADFSDLAVLAIDTDGDVWICPQSTAHENGARIITDASDLESYTGGIQDEHTADLYAAFAEELNSDPSL